MSEPALPQVLAEIAEVAGYDAAWAIARARGGQEITLPARPGPRHWLTQLVGQESATQICTYFRGEHRLRILIPMGSALRRRERFEQVLASGASVHRAAAELGVHRRTVFRHRAKLRDQGDLFSED